MAYPTESAAIALQRIDQLMIRTRQLCASRKADMASGDVTAELVLDDLRANLLSLKAEMAELSATPGLIEEARRQKNDGNLDIVSEYQAVIAAIDDLLASIAAAAPKDASGYLLIRKLTATGYEHRTFTPAQTAGLRMKLDAVIAAISLG